MFDFKLTIQSQTTLKKWFFTELEPYKDRQKLVFFLLYKHLEGFGSAAIKITLTCSRALGRHRLCPDRLNNRPNVKRDV